MLQSLLIGTCFVVASQSYPITTSNAEYDFTKSLDYQQPLSSVTLPTKFSFGDLAAQKLQSIKSSQASIESAFYPPTRETALLESESFLSQKESAYGRVQQMVGKFLNAKPIVDTIQEHEKYGNTGDKFRGISKAVVGGFEGISNAINAAVEIPFEVLKSITRKTSAALNQIGAKIAGL